MSPAFRLMTGYEPETSSAAIPPRTVILTIWGPPPQAIGRLLSGHPTASRSPTATRHRTRGWVWVESTIRPVRDAAGEVVEYILVARDISARKARDAALRESASSACDLALSAADMGLWDLDLDRQAIMHDPRFAAQLGYAPAEAEPADRRRGI